MFSVCMWKDTAQCVVGSWISLNLLAGILMSYSHRHYTDIYIVQCVYLMPNIFYCLHWVKLFKIRPLANNFTSQWSHRF